MTPVDAMPEVELHCGDCLDWLPSLADQSVDLVLCDPPYPEIDRPYGRWTEAEWWSLIVEGVIPHVRRILKPTGSAVFILQPNSRKVGSMRGWLFRFQAWACDHWNLIQDAYWFRYDILPTEGAPTKGLMRQSVKPCVWLGPADCYRNQDAVLWTESDHNKAARLAGRCGRNAPPSKMRTGTTPRTTDQKRARAAAGVRGGVTPFNVLLFANGSHRSGHSAPTSQDVADWWTRYLCPPGGTCCDPFAGSGTMALAALKHGASFVGCERMSEYHATARRRFDAALAEQPLFSTLGA